MSENNKENGKNKRNEKQVNFEDAMKRLEKIVEEMESGKMDLETMISRFEEGQKLIKFCSAKLNEIEKRVEMLVKKDGEITKEPFDETQIEEDKKTSNSNNNLPF